MTNKTHFRKIHKSDHLAVCDLEEYTEEGLRLVFTVDRVAAEYGAKVAGKKVDKNIMYFKPAEHKGQLKNIKPWCLNATNEKLMRKLTNSPFMEDWAGFNIELYVDPNVTMMGEQTGGVRIHPNLPAMQKKAVTPDNKKMWENAKAAYKRDGNFDKVLEKADISEENQSKIIAELADKIIAELADV